MSAQKRAPKAPKNWPLEILYLTTPIYSRSLTQAHLSSLKVANEDSPIVPANCSKRFCALVRITTINDPSHPAVGQCGLFAASDLKPGSFVLQYLGEIHASSLSPDCDPYAESNYDLSLDRELGIGVDANKMGNEARFINDYRGIADRPNAEFKEIWDEKRKEKGMGVFVLPEGKNGKGKGVKKGQELLVSYGRGFWRARTKEG